MREYVVFDIGGTFIKYALMGEDAAILEHGKIPTPKGEREKLIDALAETARPWLGRASGCAVSMPGRIDPARGLAITAGALNDFLGGCPVAPLLEERIGVPVILRNDGQCAIVGEHWKGALRDVRNGMVIAIGTGIGGGLLLEGKPYIGSHFCAGEISMLISDIDTLAAGYGRDGKIDDSAPFWTNRSSAKALLQHYRGRKQIAADVEGKDRLDGEQFFAAVDEGEQEALETLDWFARETAAGIYSLQTVLDLERIAVGGGVSAAAALIPAIQDKVHEMFARFVTLPAKEPEVVAGHFGNDANLIGALKMALDSQCSR